MSGKHKTRSLLWVSRRMRKICNDERDQDKWNKIYLEILDGEKINCRVDIKRHGGIRNMRWQWFTD